MKNCTNHPNWIKGHKNSLLSQKLNRDKIKEEYNNKPNKCMYCNKPIPYNKKRNKYCSNVCSGLNQTRKNHTKETKNKIKNSILKNPKCIKNICNIKYNKCMICNKIFITPSYKPRKTCSDKCYKKNLSNVAKKNSLLRGNKNRHAFWYNSPIAGKVFLESSWEKKLAEDLDKNNIQWIRPKNNFKWKDKDGKIKRYYPDFYIPELNLYIDPKNPYLAKLDKYKINYVIKKYNLNLLIISDPKLLSLEYIKNNFSPCSSAEKKHEVSTLRVVGSNPIKGTTLKR